LDIWTCPSQPPDGTAGMVNGESFCMAAPVSGATDGFFDDERKKSGWVTYLAGNLLLIVGLTSLGSGWWTPPKRAIKIVGGGKKAKDAGDDGTNGCDTTGDQEEEALVRITKFRACVRILTVYVLGCAAVCIWHGIWYLIDFYFMTQLDAVLNWWTTTLLGGAICFAMLAGNSLLAPPAIFLTDGPGFVPPPIGVTLWSSYKSITRPAVSVQSTAVPPPPKEPIWISTADTLMSYLWLPWPVLGFWRGFWYLMDAYLYGYGDQQALYMSLLYSTVLALGCLFLGSEDIVQHIPSPTESVIGANYPRCVRLWNHLLMRVRTIVLTIGTVNFWRATWLTWDEFMGSTTVWSAALSHVLGVLVLLALGCSSCICAPPSTLGVDAIAVANCADEPLFFNVPVAAEALYFLGIARQADTPPGPEVELSQPPQLRPILEKSDSTRFYQQAGSQLEGLIRSESNTSLRLNKRNKTKRLKSQFFRSR